MPGSSMTEPAGSENCNEVLTHVPALRIYARSLTLRYDDADQLVQSTLLQAISGISKYQPGANLRTWLITIMRTTFETNFNKSEREAPSNANSASPTSVFGSSEVGPMLGHLLFRALARLPMSYREILILVVVIGESYEEAGRICDCGIDTVKTRVNRARKMLIEELSSTESFRRGNDRVNW